MHGKAKAKEKGYCGDLDAGGSVISMYQRYDGAIVGTTSLQ